MDEKLFQRCNGLRLKGAQRFTQLGLLGMLQVANAQEGIFLLKEMFVTLLSY